MVCYFCFEQTKKHACDTYVCSCCFCLKTNTCFLNGWGHRAASAAGGAGDRNGFNAILTLFKNIYIKNTIIITMFKCVDIVFNIYIYIQIKI